MTNKPISEMYDISFKNMRELKFLNLGCGKIVYPNFDNIDKIKYPGVLNLDLCKSGWELNLESNYYDFIYSNHFFEHIENTEDFINIMQGLFAVAKNNCIFEVRVPYPHLKILKDLDHYRLVDVNTFKRFMDKPTNSLTTYEFKPKGYLEFIKRIPKGYTLLNIKPWALHLIFIIKKV